MSNQSFKDQTLLKHLVVILKIVSPVNLAGGRGETVRGLGLIMNWNVSSVLMARELNTLEKVLGICSQEA